jgi:hypothetical protein
LAAAARPVKQEQPTRVAAPRPGEACMCRVRHVTSLAGLTQSHGMHTYACGNFVGQPSLHVTDTRRCRAAVLC